MNKNDEDFIDGRHEQKKPVAISKGKNHRPLFLTNQSKEPSVCPTCKESPLFEYIFLFFPDK